MKKLLKFIIGGLACLILLMYLVLPFVKVGEESYNFFTYIGYIFTNISLALKNTTFNSIEMLHTVVAWLLILVIVVAPILCLITVAVKGVFSGLLTKRDLKVVSAELLSFVFSGFLIGFSYYLVYKYTLSYEANQLQIEMVKIACSSVWQPLLYISAFGSLALAGMTVYANSMKKKKEKEEE
ncbi:MAG: hypothetical protein IJX78_03970 [Bacilli bacterium]|nr:hypothetical protein [Bacilli bacterium]